MASTSHLTLKHARKEQHFTEVRTEIQAYNDDRELSKAMPIQAIST